MPLINVRVNDELKAQFEKALEVNETQASDVLRDFIRSYIQSTRERREYEAWFAENVRTGLAQAAAGETITNEQMKAKAQIRRKRLLARKS